MFSAVYWHQRYLNTVSPALNYASMEIVAAAGLAEFGRSTSLRADLCFFLFKSDGFVRAENWKTCKPDKKYWSSESNASRKRNHTISAGGRVGPKASGAREIVPPAAVRPARAATHLGDGGNLFTRG